MLSSRQFEIGNSYMAKISKQYCAITNLVIFLVFIFTSFSVQATKPQEFSRSTHSQQSVGSINHPVDLWGRIRHGFVLPSIKHSDVKKYEASFTQNPEKFQQVIDRSRRYLFYIVEEVERRGIPAEIALLPLIESAFDPSAQSSGSATGLWQFIPSTGKNFGLNQNEWHDDRRDVVAATSAALDYLQNLHKQFGDWRLALAAYNWGEGSIIQLRTSNREQGKSVNFHQMELPQETRNLVYKLMAVRNIIERPKEFGIKLKSIPNRPYFDEVAAHHPIDIKLAAKLANISINEFKALNPAHKSAIVQVTDSPRVLLLPINKKDIFLRNLEAYNEPLTTWQIHQVKNGENADELSKRFNISLKQLKEINGIAHHETLKQDQEILVPRISKRIDADISIVRQKPVIIDKLTRKTLIRESLSSIRKLE